MRTSTPVFHIQAPAKYRDEELRIAREHKKLTMNAVAKFFRKKDRKADFFPKQKSTNFVHLLLFQQRTNTHDFVATVKTRTVAVGNYTWML